MADEQITQTQYATIPHDLTALAAEVGAWQDVRWPQHGNSISKALKVAEEAGEVAGAVIKRAEGRKTLMDIANEIGDTVIALAGLCETLDIPFGVAVGARWFEVRNRPDPSSGSSSAPPE